MRIVLVQPPHRDTFGYSMPPLGPLHLGAAARALGHDVTFVDLALLVRRGTLPAHDAPSARALPGRCRDLLLALEPDVLGFTSMVSSLPAALHLAHLVHAARPELPILLGGQGPETVEEAVVARHPCITAVAVGEADVTFCEWLAAHETGRDPATVPGLVLRREGRPHRTPARGVVPSLDAVAPPAWDLAESPAAYAAAAGGGEALFPIDLGRGCTHACTFCTTPVFWGRTARHLSPTRAVDELDRLAALDGLDCAYVTHDLFTFDRERVLAICDEKMRRGNTLPWECRTRIDLVDADLLATMRAAGCRRILYGVESDRPSMLAAIHKGGRTTGPAAVDVRDTLRMASVHGMASIVGTMAGIPGESAEDVEANLQLMAEVATLDGVSLSMHWFNVTPGNGRATEVGEQLVFMPGLTADLVRGYDLPAGFLHEEIARLIEDDAEVFAAFRVFAPAHAEPVHLYLLSRNAHIALEVLPRTLRALARSEGTSLRTLLVHELMDASARGEAGSFPATEWVEPRVLQRRACVEIFARRVQRHGDASVMALCAYETSLFDTDTARLVRFARDPLPLVRAVDAGEWPNTAEPTAAGDGSGAEATATVLFCRHGERVRAARVSALLADALGGDDAGLASRWPDRSEGVLRQARVLARQLLGDGGPPRLVSDEAVLSFSSSSSSA